MSSRQSRQLFRGMLMLAAATSTIAAAPVLAQTWTGYQPYTVPAIAQTQSSPAQTSASSIADVVEHVTPAVVNIVVTSSTGEVTSLGQGSGFVISPQGEVVTNYHVIEGGSEISVIFKNGNRFPAQVIGEDEETDLALLKLSLIHI